MSYNLCLSEVGLAYNNVELLQLSQIIISLLLLVYC